MSDTDAGAAIYQDNAKAPVGPAVAEVPEGPETPVVEVVVPDPPVEAPVPVSEPVAEPTAEPAQQSETDAIPVETPA